jgi:hypothetical protein
LTKKKIFDSEKKSATKFIPDGFYKKNILWLDKMRENNKKAELLQEEERRYHNKEIPKIRERLERSRPSK